MICFELKVTDALTSIAGMSWLRGNGDLLMDFLLDLENPVDAPVVAAAFGWGVQPQFRQLCHLVIVFPPGTQAQHVGVVVAAGRGAVCSLWRTECYVPLGFAACPS